MLVVAFSVSSHEDFPGWQPCAVEVRTTHWRGSFDLGMVVAGDDRVLVTLFPVEKMAPGGTGVRVRRHRLCQGSQSVWAQPLEATDEKEADQRTVRALAEGSPGALGG